MLSVVTINFNNTKRRVKQANFDIVNDIFLTYLYKYFHEMNANKALYYVLGCIRWNKEFSQKKGHCYKTSLLSEKSEGTEQEKGTAETCFC